VTTFAGLLEAIHEAVPQIRRLRFVTSYPRDFGDDALEVIRDCERICPYLHVPVQSGSDRILKMMNRGYSVGQYEEFVARAVETLPDVSIAGDIIVGFPTESEADFEATAALIKRIPFKNNFVFRYSPRPGTTAIDRFPDDVPDEVKRRRVNALLDLQSVVSEEAHAALIGTTQEIFIEKLGKGGAATSARPQAGLGGRVQLGWARPETQLSGRTMGDHITVFSVPSALNPAGLIGEIRSVRIESAGPRLLRGRLIPEEATGLAPV
jgi:tRNA-2-methylthio-N6-dimethylallyladenosine synthase